MSIIRNLSESLENRYSLQEAFDESMPDWLKKALGATAAHSTGVYNVGNNKYHYNKSGHKSDKYDYPRVDYQQKRGAYGDEKEATSLADRFLELGIDISKMKVHDAPMPDKVPRITKNQQIIPIFKFANGQVWAKGVNDREKYYDANNPWDEKPFKALSSKQVIDDAVEYCYIDLNDPAVADKPVADIREKRKQLLSELAQIGNYFKNTHWYTDKSGYNRKVNSAKYAEKAKELKIKKIPQTFDKICAEAAELVEIVKDFVSDADIKDYGMLQQCADCFNRLTRVQDYIRYSENSIAELIATSESDYMYNSKVNIVIHYLESAQRELDRAKNHIQHFGKTVVDW